MRRLLIAGLIFAVLILVSIPSTGTENAKIKQNSPCFVSAGKYFTMEGYR